jgi:hypothetical protein
MKPRIYDYCADHPSEGAHLYAFHCPGCGYDHAFLVGGDAVADKRPRWQFLGSFEKPTFSPSLLCNKDDPKRRCHSVVTDGKIAFQRDCFHCLAGQTVEMPDWEEAL